MAQQAKQAVFPILVPANVLRKIVADGSSLATPTTHMGDLDEVPGSWLWSGSISLHDSDFQINK